MIFIWYPRCSTCQKAKKWLDEHGIAYTARHIKEDNPSLEELGKWYSENDIPLKKFFNTSGMLYRDLGLKDRLPRMSDEEKLKLLSTDGMLVKRPVILRNDGKIILGFSEKAYEEAFKPEA